MRSHCFDGRGQVGNISISSVHFNTKNTKAALGSCRLTPWTLRNAENVSEIHFVRGCEHCLCMTAQEFIVLAFTDTTTMPIRFSAPQSAMHR